MNLASKIIVCLALLLVMPGVSATVLSPGDIDHEINCNGTELTFLMSCENCTVDNSTCPPCNEAEEVLCADCEIDAIIEPGEIFELVEAPCDINVRCKECEEEEATAQQYDFNAAIDKSQGDDIDFSFWITNPEGENVDNRTFDFNLDDVASIHFQTNFTCEQNLYFSSANSRTCAVFWTEYQDKYGTDMSRYIISTAGQCEEELAACKKERDIANGQADSRLGLFSTERAEKTAFQMNLSIVSDQLAKAEKTCADGKKGLVPEVWMYSTWLLVVVIVMAVIVFAATGKGGFG